MIGAFIEPGRLPPSTNDQRCTTRANMVLGSAEVLLLLQRGYVDVGFMGGAQIDQFGNLNSSFIGDPAHPKTRLPGHGRRQRHREPDVDDRRDEAREAAVRGARRFRDEPRVGSTATDRGASAVCPTGGMFRVVTDLAVFGFDDDTRRMKVVALNPCVTREQVQDNTGFELVFDRETARHRAADVAASSRRCANWIPIGGTSGSSQTFVAYGLQADGRPAG